MSPSVTSSPHEVAVEHAATTVTAPKMSSDPTERFHSSINASHAALFDLLPPNVLPPMAVRISAARQEEARIACDALGSVLEGLVAAYPTMEELQQRMPLSSEAQSLLAPFWGRPYHLGSWRPDVLMLSPREMCLQNEQGQQQHALGRLASPVSMRVCEINARFTLNGYLMSEYLASVVPGTAQLPVLHALCARMAMNLHDDDNNNTNKCNSDGTLDRLVVLKGREPGWDVKLLSKDQRLAGRVDVVSPSDLYVRDHDGALCYHGNNASSGEEADGMDATELVATRVVMELHQDELQALPMGIVRALANVPHLLNDLRTVFLVHDKRMLSILSDVALLERVHTHLQMTMQQQQQQSSSSSSTTAAITPASFSMEDAHTAAQVAVPTWQVRDVRAVRRDVVRCRGQYLIKAHLLGKGKGMVFGKDVTEDEWVHLLEAEERQHDIVQPFLDQAPLYEEDKVTDQQQQGQEQQQQQQHEEQGQEHTGALCVVPLHNNNDTKMTSHAVQWRPRPPEGSSHIPLRAVGMWLNMDRRHFGWGIFRAAHKDIVNVVGHGTVLAPQLATTARLPALLPGAALFTVSSTEEFAASTPAIHAAWRQSGVVLIQRCGDALRDEEMDKACMLQYVEHTGGHVNIHGSSDVASNGVWDIRLAPHITPAERARSQTLDEFVAHTDCSFEEPPPRGMVLSVVEADAHGGGMSFLHHGNDIARHLTKQDMDVLSNTDFPMRVPAEFFKGTSTLHAPILLATTPHYLWRYRRETVLFNECTAPQQEALAHMEEALAASTRYEFLLPRGAMLLLDNARWLHGRGHIHDPNRHLRRLRFHPK